MSHNWFPGQQPQTTGPYQQQWGAAGPAGYGQPQQAQGWAGGGGQWGAGQVPGQYQQPGFPGQHGMQPGFGPQQQQQSHSQYPMSGPQGPEHGPRTGFSQQQLMQQQQLQAMQQRQQRQQAYLREQQRQQAYLQEQQRQQAYLQEQQRLAKEEQRKREFEIQKRKLAQLGVSKTSKPAANPLDDLFGKKPPSVSTSSSSLASHRAAPAREQPAVIQTPTKTQQPSETQPPSSKPQPPSSKPQPPSEPQPPHPALTGLQKTTPTAAEEEGQEMKEAAKSAKLDAASVYEKLMAESLSNLNLQTSPVKGSSEFKVPVPVATPLTHPTATAQPLQQSTRARAWTGDIGDFSGVFAQQLPQPPPPVDNFGEFQSGAAIAAAASFPTDPAAQQTQLLTQLPNLGQVTANQRPPVVPQILSTTTPTTAYTRPILATSIASGMTSSVQDQPFSAGRGAAGIDTSRMRSTSVPVQPQLQNRDPAQSGTDAPSIISAREPSQGGGTTGSVVFTKLTVSRFPPVYQEVYKKCAVSGSQFVSTELLFPILTSSGLPRGVLKELWTTANRAIPGKLSETELCVLLGLVGLKQSGHPSPSVEDLKKVPQPPIPKLSTIPNLAPNTAQPLPAPAGGMQRQAEDDFGDFQEASRAVTSQPPPLRTPTGKILQPVQPVKPELPPPLLPQSSSTMILPQPLAPRVTQPSSTSTSSTGAPSSHKPETSVPSQITPAHTQPGNFGKDVETNVSKESLFPPPKVQSDSKSFNVAGSGLSLEFDAFAGFKSEVAQLPVSTSRDKGISSQAKRNEGSFLALHSGEKKGQDKESWADFSQFGNRDAFEGLTTGTSKPTAPTTSTASSVVPSLLANAAKQEPETNVTTSDAEPRLLTSPLGLEILEEQFLAKIMQQESKATPTDNGPKASSDQRPPPQGDEDFGEFEAYSSPTAKLPPSGKPQARGTKGFPTNWTLLSKSQESDAVRVWITCLSKCEEILGASAGVFAGVQEPGILEEIVKAEEGRNKLRGIAEVYRLSKRIHCSLRSCDTSSTVERLAEGILQHWRTLGETLPNNIMEQLYLETAPRPLKDETESVDVLSDSISKCSLCLEAKRVVIPPTLALDGKGEEYGLQLLFHKGQSYHATCANFWCNAVQEELPTL